MPQCKVTDVSLLRRAELAPAASELEPAPHGIEVADDVDPYAELIREGLEHPAEPEVEGIVGYQHALPGEDRVVLGDELRDATELFRRAILRRAANVEDDIPTSPRHLVARSIERVFECGEALLVFDVTLGDEPERV